MFAGTWGWRGPSLICGGGQNREVQKIPLKTPCCLLHPITDGYFENLPPRSSRRAGATSAVVTNQAEVIFSKTSSGVTCPESTAMDTYIRGPVSWASALSVSRKVSYESRLVKIFLVGVVIYIYILFHYEDHLPESRSLEAKPHRLRGSVSYRL